MRNTRIVALRVAAIAAVVAVAAQAQMHPIAWSKEAEAVVDANGNLHVPHAYRTTYQFLGSWAVASDQGQGAKELHVVYASPGTVTAYRNTGGFPDGAVLVKEVYMATTGKMTTGTVSHAETLKGWFVLMKDEHARYPSNRLWGDGWGWSWFDAANPSKTTSTDYKTDCRGCHVPAKASDWIYVTGYPSLGR
jgi:hypothetical protein